MYNEEEGAERCVHEVCNFIQANIPSCCLFVVNDGSRDHTERVLVQLKAAEPSLPFEIISYKKNCGYGGALVKGAQAAEQAGYAFALFMDSDLTNPPAMIRAFHDIAASGRYDLIKASRYIPGGGMKGVPWNRRIFSNVGNRIASFLFSMGIHDCTNGFRAVRLEILRDICFQESGFPSILEELYHLKRKAARVTEIPSILTARQKGEGVSKFHYNLNTLFGYLKYAIKAGFLKERTH
jgi:dolichol-phosphate mannosyltransferase